MKLSLMHWSAAATAFAAVWSSLAISFAEAGETPLAAPSSNTLTHLPLVPHRHQRARRNLLQEDEEEPPSSRRRQDAVQVGALYQGYGTHYVDLWVGTPTPQRQTLIVDTGSGVTAFPCSGCAKDCGSGHHVDEFFDENQSTSFEKAACDSCKRGHCTGGGGECRISMSYQEGSSWSAFEAVDQAYIGGPHSHGLSHDNGGKDDIDPNHAFAFGFPMTFGCQTHLTGLFKTQLADGIMGMDDAGTAFWSQMNAHKILSNKQFSLCFTRQPTADREGTEAGAMTMGGYDKRFHTSPLIYAARQGGRSGFYSIHVRKFYLRDGSGGDRAKATNPNAKVITLNVNEANLNHGNVILDSGTTDTYFTRKIGTEFNAAYHTLTGKAYSHTGVSLTEEQLNALPTLLIQIVGHDESNKKLYKDPSNVAGFAGDLDPDNPYDLLLAIPASHYMEFDDKQGKYVARFYPDEGGGSVIGANAMMGHDLFFDLDNDRFGFAESECDYGKLLTDAGFEDPLAGGDSSETPPATKPPKQKPDTSKNAHDSATPSDKDTIHQVHPAIAACSDTTCRASVGGAAILLLIVGLLLGRCCCHRSGKGGRYGKAGGEMEMKALEDFTDVRYRDDPESDDENGVAAEGTGYKDVPAVPTMT